MPIWYFLGYVEDGVAYRPNPLAGPAMEGWIQRLRAMGIKQVWWPSGEGYVFDV